MNGKQRCKILKEIRREIARQNDIDLIISECRFQGDCRGTCPKCEAEVRFLEDELQKRRMDGKKIAVAGVAAAMMLSATACAAPSQEPQEPTTTSQTDSCETDYILDGDVAYVPDDTTDWLLGEEPDPFEDLDGYGSYV